MSMNVGFFAFGLLVSLAVSLLFFIFQAIGTYRIMKNRGMTYAWMGCIPILCDIALGRVADDINGRINKNSYYRYFMLGTTILSKVVLSFMASGIFTVMLNILSNNGLDSDSVLELFMMFIARMAFAALFSLIHTIVRYIVLYRIFVDYTPNNAVLYIVLSVFFKVVEPFFIYSIRNTPSISISQQNAQSFYTPPMYQ